MIWIADAVTVSAVLSLETHLDTMYKVSNIVLTRD